MRKLSSKKRLDYQRAALPHSAITPHTKYLSRRDFIRNWGLMGAALASGSAAHFLFSPAAAKTAAPARKFNVPVNSSLSTGELKTGFEEVTSYNNFYEFGTSKLDPARNAHTLITDPWSVDIQGAAVHNGQIGLEQLIDERDLEERIYRLRCVEGWSMVIPWIGVPLAGVIKKLQPEANAKYVEFTTLADPQQMPGLARNVLDWPYREGLRMDEAMNPLTLLAVGLYGDPLPNQNGAPLRLVVPWKYGFKSIKSIVGIRFRSDQPKTSWNLANAREYGFYSNVNPEVAHPRWSQARERRIGEDGFFTPKRKTLMFNGYGEQVASLYKGMDLRANF